MRQDIAQTGHTPLFDRALADMDRLFGRGDMPGINRSRSAWTPALDISEDDDAYYVAMDLPGAMIDDIDVSIEDGELHLAAKFDRTPESSAETNGSPEDADAAKAETSDAPNASNPTRKVRWLHRERKRGNVMRRIQLPDDVDSDSVDAELRDGVLHVTLTRVPASARVTCVPVRPAHA